MKKLLLLVLLLAIANASSALQQRTRIPAEPGNGAEWLEWDQGVRELYVYAYLVGRLDGSTHACLVAGELFGRTKAYRLDEVPFYRCKGNVRRYSRNLDDYAETVTGFYEAYPEHRSYAARLIIRQLYDDSGITLDDLPRMAESGGLIH